MHLLPCVHPTHNPYLACLRLFRYKVVKKGRKASDDVAQLLLSFADCRTGKIPCGIVYCLSRKETEDLATALQQLKQPNGRLLTVKCVSFGNCGGQQEFQFTLRSQ